MGLVRDTVRTAATGLTWSTVGLRGQGQNPRLSKATVEAGSGSLHRSRRVVTFIPNVLKKEGTWG
jgi:hypothetical protein